MAAAWDTRLRRARAGSRGLEHKERGAEVRLGARRLAAAAWEVRAGGRGLGMGRMAIGAPRRGERRYVLSNEGSCSVVPLKYVTGAPVTTILSPGEGNGSETRGTLLPS